MTPILWMLVGAAAMLSLELLGVALIALIFPNLFWSR
jgi:hypothetical protein